MQEGSLFFILSPAFVVGRFLDDGHSDWLRGYFIVVLMLISLIIGFSGDTVVKKLPASSRIDQIYLSRVHLYCLYLTT